MSKNNCELIKDLLPLYADDVCSEESRKAVAEHIAECSDCRSDLEKMGQHIAVEAENDIKVIKRIKRRVWIERIVITGVIALVAFIGMIALKMMFLDMVSTMDYEKHNLSENMWIEVDDNGDLWLVKKGIAAESIYIYPTLRDENGNYLGHYEQAFYGDSIVAYGFSLDYRSIIDLSDIEISVNEERNLLFNINKRENIDEVFYYDEAENKEYILWERD